MRAALYARISEDRTGEAAGVRRQLDDARKLAADRGWSVVFEEHDNDLSALKGSTRPAYAALLAEVAAGRVDVIVVWQSARLWRNRRERADGIDLLRKHGVAIAAVKGTSLDLSTATGRMIAGILGEFDTGESEVKGERIARAARQRAEDGQWHGGRRRFGYTAKAPVELVPAEAAEIETAYRGLLAGVPVAALVRGLRERGVSTVEGGQWSGRTLAGILLRPTNAGLAVSRGEVVGHGDWPKIVSEDIWRAAVALLSDPARRTSTGNRASYLLSGIASCGVCGGTITSAGAKRSNKDDGRRYMYRCRTKNCVGRRRDWIDTYVADAVIGRLSRDDARDLLIDHNRPDFEALRDEARAIRGRLDQAAAQFADDVITDSQLRTITMRCRTRLVEIEAAQAHTDRAAILVDLVDADDVRAAWEGLPLDRQRAVVKTLVTVQLHPGGGGYRSFDPTKVEISWKV